LQHCKFAACSTDLQHVVTFAANLQHNFFSPKTITVVWVQKFAAFLQQSSSLILIFISCSFILRSSQKYVSFD
jgi:hypothetical protein